jgi:hypothetical protein
MRPWFAQRGYVLNELTYIEWGDVNLKAETPMSTFFGEVRYPYSHVGGCKECEPTCILPHTRSHVTISYYFC